ncbi:glutamate ligase domain-containing protein [Streptomyces sp. NEAU-Y11]|uniref:glutamate ligase domain-containing protein n=1 Tax=Streptomyces cucumeris TaxID=2962890 RepID=UPI0020C910D9|nr:cyanophycin synthetase [Streptomyces sp. NEAU-Y11]MCP9211460.1 hypothetical protein [Streptomyces sp. NEAU-Y11]
MEARTRADGVTIVNDAWNTNPDSMTKSMRALAAMARGQDQRSIAVLGRMDELGDDSRAAHEEVDRMAAELRLDQLVAVGGEEARWMQQAAERAGARSAAYMPDQDSTLDHLQRALTPGTWCW